MTTTELLAIFRDEVSDAVLPYLWSDALVYAYIDDAQKQFCRDTYGIEDSRSFKLSVTVAAEWYAIDAKILQIKAAYDTLTGNEIPVLTMEEAYKKNIRFDTASGPVQALIKGMEKGYLRAHPVPSATKTIWLRTTRLPIEVAAGDDLEIDQQHQLNLLYWVKFRAYSKQDAETADAIKAAGYKAQHVAYCEEAMTEQGRLNRNVAVVAFRF